ncbi:MAG: anti-sigma factor [Gemmatimonadaceae bacterium]
MRTFNLTCEAVEATLDDYLDGTLEAWVREAVDEHLAECDRCAARLRDLRKLEREAAVLPALAPEHDLWPEVAHDIGAPGGTSESVPQNEPLIQPNEPEVLVSPSLPISESLPTTREPSVPTSEPSVPTSEPSVSTSEPSVSTSEPTLLTAAPTAETVPPPPTTPVPATAPAIALQPRREKRRGPLSMGLAAAALVLVTAGTTFLLTVRWYPPLRTPYVVTDTVTRRLGSNATRAAGGGGGGRAATPSLRPQQTASDSAGLTPPPGPLSSSLAVATTSAPRVRSPDEVVYDKEINMLQTITRRRRTELDASTAAVIEKNLRIIDSNIAQIRAALQQDPGNSLLDDEVSRALDMKVELLRRVAMLRSNNT